LADDIMSDNFEISMVWRKYEDTVLPVIFRELVHQLASSATGNDAMERIYPLLKDVFYTGAEVYQRMMFKAGKETKEQQEEIVQSLMREIERYTEEAKTRWNIVKH
jgi:hypothetical protein